MERILATQRQGLIVDFLLWLQSGGHVEWSTPAFTPSWLSKPKKTAFDFLLLGESLQKRTLKDNPAWIKKLITVEMQAKDFLRLQGSDPKLEEMMKQFPPEENLVYMPHLILSLGDRDIITSVFQTKGFDPYFRTSLGNNLLHSFMLFGRLEKRFNDNIKGSSYKKALQLLIEKSPPALLTQKNDMGLTPLVWAAFLDDSISYELFMKAMDSKDVFAEIPSLEREILHQGAYHLFPPLNEFLLKFDKRGERIEIGEGGRIFMSFDSVGKKSAERAGFMFSEPQHSIVMFNFKNLISQSRFTDFVKFSFNESQKYENGRISEITKIFSNPQFKEIQDIQMAVFKRDLKALRKGLRNMAGAPAYNRTKTTQMVLEESIRSQFEEGVLTAVRITNDTELAFYDPVFLALLNYVSLDKRHPRKAAAKRIIRILAKRQSKKEASPDILFWSMFFGLPEELKFFVEEMGLSLDPIIVDQGLQYALQEDHVKIFNYLSQSLKKDPKAMFSCKDIFIN